jgi:short-subunit dehydrogenase
MFKDKFGPWGLIIGGSEGIGRSLAVRLAAQGLNIVMVARKRPALEEAAAVIRGASKVEVRTLSQDVTAPDAMDAIRAFTSDIDVGLMIYNAGAMDRITTFLGDRIEGHLHTLRLNCEGPTRMCHHFGGRMRDRQRGGIVLMSSVSGLAGSYGVPIYGATKAFDMILGEGLWYEFKDFGVSVLTAVLGSVSTPSHERLFGGHLPEGGARVGERRCRGRGDYLRRVGRPRSLPDLARRLDGRAAVLAAGAVGGARN